MIRSQTFTCRTIRSLLPALAVKCPKCAASSKVFRTPFPHIDTCGFEKYAFRCDRCGIALGGVINPLDDKLYVSLLDPAIEVTASGY
jgi:hypothetical protein